MARGMEMEVAAAQDNHEIPRGRNLVEFQPGKNDFDLYK
jgi:hypothetical protein